MGSPPVYFLEFAIFLPAAASRKMIGLWENSGRDLVITPPVGKATELQHRHNLRRIGPQYR